MITASGSMWSLAAMETRARWASTFRPAAPAARPAIVRRPGQGAGWHAGRAAVLTSHLFPGVS